MGVSESESEVKVSWLYLLPVQGLLEMACGEVEIINNL